MKKSWNIKGKKRKRLGVVICIGVLISAACAFSAEAMTEVKREPDAGRWFYHGELSLVNREETEKEPLGFWKHYDPGGELDVGWLLLDGFWYFLSTEENEKKGRMLTGWQWIDGRCYYLSAKASGTCPEGSMYANAKTPDGYLVGSSGAWLKVDGTEWQVPGKGLLGTSGKNVNQTGKSGKSGSGIRGGSPGSVGGGGSGGGSQGSGGNGGGSQGSGRGSQGSGRGGRGSQGSGDGQGSGGGSHNGDASAQEQIPESPSEEDGGGENAPSPLPSLPPENEDNQATPSQAKLVCWEMRFVDEKDKNSKILRMQRGKSKEGAELCVDFPEMVSLEDRRYQALEKSPYHIRVAGAGIQKYEILFQEMEPSTEEPEDHEERERLSDWLLVASNADRDITGQIENSWPIITENQEESKERTKNLISMVHDGKRHEIYLVARNHLPSTVVIGQVFPDAAGISELLMDEFSIREDQYRILRVGFYRTQDEDDCTHELECVNHVAPGCLTGGRDTYQCLLCGFEETLLSPATGHRDKDGDGFCDMCYEPMDGGAGLEGVHYQLGDVQIRNIGGKPYRFRCIDEDYGNERDAHGAAALFLCESVIRSDIEMGWGESGNMGFGPTNNYKTSHVRRWLQKNVTAASGDLLSIYTGVNTAFQGATAPGKYEQFSFDELKAYEKPFQLMEDQVFLLSLEEAVRYRSVLWRFNGSHENNPQSQYSPYSKGYYLRTPQYKGGNGFEYGNAVYAVDLASGSLRPADVSHGEMGIRPAMAVKQS